MTEPSTEFIPYGRQTITEADINAVCQILRSPAITQGPVVPAFECSVANNVGAKYAVAVNSATSALHIACLAIGLGPGDWLWTSPTTFVASANCGLYCGASIDFVDIDLVTGLMDIDTLRKKLEIAKRNQALPKVLIPVHLTGASCDMKAIRELSHIYGFSIIEDASHAIGGKFSNQPVGKCEYSDITVFSFHPVKIITTGEGGMATTNNKYLAEKMQKLRSHGITKDQNSFQFEPAGPWAYEQQMLGFNYRMTDIQAALGLSQMARLSKIIKERNKLYLKYQELLSDLPVKLLKIPEGVFSAVHLAVIRLNDSNASTHRLVFEGLRGHGIGVQLHYEPVYLQPYYQKIGFRQGYCPNSEAYSASAISLPLYPGLTDLQILRVVQNLKLCLADSTN